MPPLIWPLPGQAPLFPDAPGRFAARRTHENHTGVDLYAETGQPVVSTEDGVVIGIECFTGAHVPETASFWWNDTWAVLVEGASGVVVYGEIRPGVEVGQRLRAGDLVGKVIPVLRTFKGRPMVMLHVELLRPGTRKTAVWPRGTRRPRSLLDPTPLLRSAAGEPTAQEFDLDFYDGLRFRDPAAPVKVKYAFGQKLLRP